MARRRCPRLSGSRFVQEHPCSLSLLVHRDDKGRGDTPYDTGAELALKQDWANVFSRVTGRMGVCPTTAKTSNSAPS
jgi:hypothetical protein